MPTHNIRLLAHLRLQQFSTSQSRKRLPSLPDLTISTNTTTTTHNEGIILQSNQSNSTEQKKKKTIHVVYSLLSMTG